MSVHCFKEMWVSLQQGASGSQWGTQSPLVPIPLSVRDGRDTAHSGQLREDSF